MQTRISIKVKELLNIVTPPPFWGTINTVSLANLGPRRPLLRPSEVSKYLKVYFLFHLIIQRGPREGFSNPHIINDQSLWHEIDKNALKIQNLWPNLLQNACGQHFHTKKGCPGPTDEYCGKRLLEMFSIILKNIPQNGRKFSKTYIPHHKMQR